MHLTVNVAKLMVLALMPLAPVLASPVSIQVSMPKFYVYGESDSDRDLIHCKVAHRDAIAAVQTELRSAGIVIQADSKDPESVMDTYINIAATPLPGAKSDCAYSYELTLESFNDAANPFTGVIEFTKLSYCHKTVMLIGKAETAQATINGDVRAMAKDCLDKYRNRNSK
ncbi:MAG: hypothetical protein J0M19_00265 [Sphingomonadales bacterium]|nr:hypothetical protein [Sphingomonadales bacterium]